MARPPWNPALADALRRGGLSEKEIVEAVGPEAPAYVDPLVRAFLMMLGKLVDQPGHTGFPVKLPVHLEPNHFSIPITFTCVNNFAGGGAPGSVSRRIGVQWHALPDVTLANVTNCLMDADGNAPERVPNGHLAIIRRAEVTVTSGDNPDSARNAFRQFRWSLLQNNGPVSGFAEQIASCMHHQTTHPDSAGGNLENFQAGIPFHLPTPSPLVLLPGHTLEFLLRDWSGDATITWTTVGAVQGYLVPLERESRERGPLYPD